MIEEYQLRVLPQVAYKEESIKQYLAKEKGLDVRTLQHIRVLKKSVDAPCWQNTFSILSTLPRFLQIVIPDFLRTVDSLLDISRFERLEPLVVVVCPNARIVVGQQLQSDTDAVGFGFAHLVHLLVGPVENPQQIFHMMAHLVGYDISVGEISVSSELTFHRRKALSVRL